MRLHLYTDASPNGFKATVALEELAIPYELHHMRVADGEHCTAEALRRNPAGRIPVLVDSSNGITLFESAAILLYLADTSGRLIPTDTKGRWAAITWLMFHSASMGPALGNRVQFDIFEAEKLAIPIERFRRLTNEAATVLDRRLADNPYLAGETYSIADIANFGWFHIARIVGLDFGRLPHLARWHETVAARPAVQRGIAIPEPATGA